MSTSMEQSLTERIEGLFPIDNLKVAHQSSLDFREAVSEDKKSWIGTIPLLYGEIAMLEFERLLASELHAADEQVFVDLGSGSGKLVLAAAILFKFRVCRGIELMPGLHEMALAALSKLPTSAPKAEAIEFVQGDIREQDWSDADIVYCCSTSYTEELMKSLSAQSEKLKIGARVLTISYPLVSRLFEITWKGECAMSWGKATVFIQKKVHNRRLESVLLKAFYRKPAQSGIN